MGMSVQSDMAVLLVIYMYIESTKNICRSEHNRRNQHTRLFVWVKMNDRRLNGLRTIRGQSELVKRVAQEVKRWGLRGPIATQQLREHTSKHEDKSYDRCECHVQLPRILNTTAVAHNGPVNNPHQLTRNAMSEGYRTEFFSYGDLISISPNLITRPTARI